MTSAQIDIHGLSKSYRQGENIVTAVDDVNLEIRAGDFVVITGRSGAGKTTLLSLIGRLTDPTAGTICIDGVDLRALNDAALASLRARTLGFVFQFGSLLPTLTVLENVRLPSLFAGEPVLSKVEGLADSARAAELVRMVGLGDKLHNYPPQLSGGQRRRVAIARALINHPAILLADEPTGDLDVDTENEILDLFQSLNAQGMTIVLVTHSANLAPYGKRAFRMERGRLIETPCEEMTLCRAGRVLASSLS